MIPLHDVVGQTESTYEPHYLPNTWAGECNSNRTLRLVDLLPKFMYTLEEAWPEKAEFLTKAYNEIYPILQRAEDGTLTKVEELTYDNVVEEAGFLLDDLFNLLSEVAPDKCYFGASESDGVSFGFWINQEYTVYD